MVAVNSSSISSINDEIKDELFAWGQLSSAVARPHSQPELPPVAGPRRGVDAVSPTQLASRVIPPTTIIGQQLPTPGIRITFADDRTAELPGHPEHSSNRERWEKFTNKVRELIPVLAGSPRLGEG